MYRPNIWEYRGTYRENITNDVNISMKNNVLDRVLSTGHLSLTYLFSYLFCPQGGNYFLDRTGSGSEPSPIAEVP